MGGPTLDVSHRWVGQHGGYYIDGWDDVGELYIDGYIYR
jgi:hypothetical protein